MKLSMRDVGVIVLSYIITTIAIFSTLLLMVGCQTVPHRSHPEFSRQVKK